MRRLLVWDHGPSVLCFFFSPPNTFYYFFKSGELGESGLETRRREGDPGGRTFHLPFFPTIWGLEGGTGVRGQRTRASGEKMKKRLSAAKKKTILPTLFSLALLCSLSSPSLFSSSISMRLEELPSGPRVGLGWSSLISLTLLPARLFPCPPLAVVPLAGSRSDRSRRLWLHLSLDSIPFTRQGRGGVCIVRGEREQEQPPTFLFFFFWNGFDHLSPSPPLPSSHFSFTNTAHSTLVATREGVGGGVSVLARGISVSASVSASVSVEHTVSSHPAREGKGGRTLRRAYSVCLALS